MMQKWMTSGASVRCLFLQHSCWSNAPGRSLQYPRKCLPLTCCPVARRTGRESANDRRKNRKQMKGTRRKGTRRKGTSRGTNLKTTSSRQRPTQRPEGFRTASQRRRREAQNDQMYTLYTKAFGDAIMILATHIASDRIALNQEPILVATVVSMWWLVSGFRGNYTCISDGNYSSSLQISMGIPVLMGVTESLITWVLAMIPTVGIFSLMLSQKLIDSSLFMTTENTFIGEYSQGIPSELEVLLVLSITMCCWRGIHAGLRGQ